VTPAKRRFIAKKYGTPPPRQRQVWGVYDLKLGCWPVERDKLGMVKQAMATEAEAEAEALRCEEAYAHAT
jgi:hypothetical protein